MSLRTGLVLLLLLSPACALSRRGIPLEDAVPPGTASFALDPIPTPRHAVLMDWLLPLDPAHSRVEFRDLPGGDPEAYELTVRAGKSGTTIRISAGGPAGRLWAMGTLRQLIVTARGRDWVRAGRVEDAPALPLRGSKRPRAWEWEYKANLTWEARSGGPDLRELGRTELVPVLSPGGVLDATEAGVARADEFFAKWAATGVRRFAIEFDDVGFGMTPDTKDRFGTYPRALVCYLAACLDRLRRRAPGAVLYWLPQTYWTRDPRLATFARDLGTAGGLPGRIGLVLTGPEVISPVIPVAGVAAARRRFGLLATKALIYDNAGREGDHGPLVGRSPALLTQVDGVFGERGEPLNRITRLDWSWNPLAYDPIRSHLLACREIVGAAAAPALSRLIRKFPELSAGERDALYAEVVARLDPPPGAPVDAKRYLEKIRADLFGPDPGSP